MSVVFKYFIPIYICISFICLLMPVDSKDPQRRKDNIMFCLTGLFVFIVLLFLVSLFVLNRINDDLYSSIRREDYINLVKPIYNKTNIDENTIYTFINKKIDIKDFERNKYLVVRGKDFFGRKEEKSHRSDYSDFDYKLEYDEYFKILEKITNNLGGYCKVEKNVKYYVDDSAVVSSLEEFDVIDKIKDEINGKWNKNKDITSLNYKKEIKRDINNIKKYVNYKYKIKIPKDYYDSLNNYNDSIVIKEEDCYPNSCNTIYRTPKIYEDNPFLSIIYLEQVANNKLSIFLKN